MSRENTEIKLKKGRIHTCGNFFVPALLIFKISMGYCLSPHGNSPKQAMVLSINYV